MNRVTEYAQAALEGMSLTVLVSFITFGDILKASILGFVGALGGLIARFIWKRIVKK